MLKQTIPKLTVFKVILEHQHVMCFFLPFYHHLLPKKTSEKGALCSPHDSQIVPSTWPINESWPKLLPILTFRDGSAKNGCIFNSTADGSEIRRSPVDFGMYIVRGIHTLTIMYTGFYTSQVLQDFHQQ